MENVTPIKKKNNRTIIGGIIIAVALAIGVGIFALFIEKIPIKKPTVKITVTIIKKELFLKNSKIPKFFMLNTLPFCIVSLTFKKYYAFVGQDIPSYI